jgi:hypothetical protein
MFSNCNFPKAVNQWDNLEILKPIDQKLVEIQEEVPFSPFEINEKQVEQDLDALESLVQEAQQTAKREENISTAPPQPLIETAKVTKSLFKSRIKKNQNFRQKKHEDDSSEKTTPLIEENKRKSNVETTKRKENISTTSHLLSTKECEDNLLEDESLPTTKKRKWKANRETEGSNHLSPIFVTRTTSQSNFHSPSSTELIAPPSTAVDPSSKSFLVTTFKGNDLAKLRFSQQTIDSALSNKTTFLFVNPINNKQPTLFDILRTEGWNQKLENKIDVVLMPDGEYTTFDNRRVAVAKTINELSHSIEVLVNPHHHSTNAPSKFLNRVSQLQLPNPVGEVKQGTYGHAVTSRIQLSANNRKVSKNEQYGFNEYPIVITGLRGRNGKHIVVDFDNDMVFLQ